MFIGIETESTSDAVIVNTLNLLDIEGAVLISLSNLTLLEGGSYVSTFQPPSVTFQLQLIGRDANGYNFSHISDTSVEVATVSLTLSMLYNITNK